LEIIIGAQTALDFSREAHLNVSFSNKFLKSYDRLHPKHRGQIAVQILGLLAGIPRSDWGKYHAHATERITSGEYRVEIKRDSNGYEFLDLLKRNDNYKP
jgi:mRNA-degrading endonuclease RelE of RelBE toxin-antitoxin system